MGRLGEEAVMGVVREREERRKVDEINDRYRQTRVSEQRRNVRSFQKGSGQREEMVRDEYDNRPVCA